MLYKCYLILQSKRIIKVMMYVGLIYYLTYFILDHIVHFLLQVYIKC